jgi:osmotically-inducible protein OsmY
MKATEQETLARRIEERLERDAGVHALVEVQGERVTLSGRVDTPEARQAADDLARQLARGKTIDNSLEVEVLSPEETPDFYSRVDQHVEPPGSVQEIREADNALEADYMARVNDTTSLAEAGVDTYEEADTAYLPPTDPVITTDQHDNVQVLGGFSSTSMESVEVARSSDGTIGDEAIVEAVLRELREDAATTELRLDVTAARGVVRLRGVVPDVSDAENAEEVAARVPGVREVIEELTVEAV